MKARLILILAILLASFALSAPAQANLETLYQNRQFFQLRDELKNAPPNGSLKILFYRGAIANKFNRPDESNQLLEEFVKASAKESDPKMRAAAFELIADNLIKTYQYGRAAANLQILLNDYKSVLDADKLKEIGNDYKLFKALESVAPQTISFDDDTQLRAVRDKANLLNIPVEINAQKMDFVFDTGANISTITVSTARRMKLPIIEADFDVGSSTKERVKSKLAVAPQLSIGNVIVRNVVFLVFEDSALAFPQINYQINGIIGFPVIEAMRQVTITREGLMTIPAQNQANPALQNLCLDGLLPLVQGVYNNKKMTFAFDTGARTSDLYPLFFESQKEQIVKTYQPRKIKVGGAGGSQEVGAYVLKNISLDIGGKKAVFPQIKLITENVNNQSRYFYGNLGQDLIKQFDRMTLDFAAMSIVFE